jgi:hypothetical protein
MMPRRLFEGLKRFWQPEACHRPFGQHADPFWVRLGRTPQFFQENLLLSAGYMLPLVILADGMILEIGEH